MLNGDIPPNRIIFKKVVDMDKEVVYSSDTEDRKESEDMSLVKYREIEVVPEHLESRPLMPACPVTWVRDNLKPGDKLGLYCDSDNQDRLILMKVPVVEDKSK